MSPSVKQRAAGESPSTTDLPYGPLPVRPDDANTALPGSQQRDQVLRLSPLPPEPAEAEDATSADEASTTNERATSPRAHRIGAEAPADQADQPTGEIQSESSAELDLATARGDSDDDVHFGVAAKALGVSRKTVERMVKRGQLERGPSQAPATVSKRALVTVLEQRRRDVSPFMGGTSPAERQPGYSSLDAALPVGTSSELQELLRPVLEPLLEQVVAARTRAAVLESQIDGIAARSMQERARNELLLAMATGGWRERRRARREAFRHYVLGDE
jgi:hypothetical protein